MSNENFKANLKTLLETQDNRITSDVMFIVQQKRRIWRVASDSNNAMAAYVNGEDVEYEGSKKFKTLEKLEDRLKDIGDWELVYYIEIWEFVSAFLTEAAAEAYIKRNAHNLRSPRIYGWSGYRNQEWINLRNYFLDKEVV